MIPRRPGSAALATLAMVLAAFCWGVAAVIAKGAFEAGIGPGQMAEARVAVALLPLAAWMALFRRDLLSPPRGAWSWIGAFGVSVMVVNFAYYLAIDRLPVGVAVSLQYTAPVLVLVGVALLAHRSPGAVAWLAAGLTLAGAVLVSGALRGLSGVDGLGLAAGIGSALSFAAYLVSAEGAGRRGAHAASSLLYGFAVAVLLWGVVLPWWEWPVARLAEPEIVLRVLGVGLLGTLLPFLLAVWALRIISAPLAGIAATTEPVFAAGLAWLLLNESLEPMQVLGAGAVVVGVLLAQAARRPGVPTDAAAVEVTP